MNGNLTCGWNDSSSCCTYEQEAEIKYAQPTSVKRAAKCYSWNIPRRTLSLLQMMMMTVVPGDGK